MLQSVTAGEDSDQPGQIIGTCRGSMSLQSGNCVKSFRYSKNRRDLRDSSLGSPSNPRALRGNPNKWMMTSTSLGFRDKGLRSLALQGNSERLLIFRHPVCSRAPQLGPRIAICAGLKVAMLFKAFMFGNCFRPIHTLGLRSPSHPIIYLFLQPLQPIL